MSSTESTLYSPSNMSFIRSPSSTADSDITLCASGEQEYTDIEPKEKCRKTVTFSAIVTTVYPEARGRSLKPSKWKPPSKRLFCDSENVDAGEQQEARRDGSGSVSRKRRFSGITQAASQTSVDISSAHSDVHPSPGKRRNSEPRRDTSTTPPPTSKVRSLESKRGPCRLTRDSRRPSSAIRREACPPSQNTPSKFFNEINKRVQTTFNRPSFDFAAFSLHRKYVLRNVTFTPSTSHCVAVLDAGVQALLPEEFPTLAMDREKPKFVIDSADGMGDGVFANIPITSGECVLTERPVLIAPYLIAMGFPLTHFYAAMFSKLSPELLQVLKKPFTYQAQKTRQALNEGSLEFYEAIMQRYALAITLQAPSGELAELPQHRAIFPQMTKFNHSCGPNAHWKWDSSSFSLVLSAIRPIKAGEEITIAYVAPHLTSEKRRSALYSLYAFDCVCTFCRSQSPPEDGDNARLKVLSFWGRPSPDLPARVLPSFQDWCEDSSLSADVLINAHLEAVDLIEHHGLQILDTHSSIRRAPHPGRDLGMHLDHLAMCYGALGDVDNFQKWIGRALEIRGDERPGERIAFRKWMSNPMSFPAWACRVKPVSGKLTLECGSTSRPHSNSPSMCGLEAFEGMKMGMIIQ